MNPNLNRRRSALTFVLLPAPGDRCLFTRVCPAGHNLGIVAWETTIPGAILSGLPSV